MGNQTIPLICNLTATGVTDKILLSGAPFSLQAFGATTASTGAATVLVEVSNVPAPTDDGHWATAATITLTLGTTLVKASNDAGGSLLPYKWARANVTALTGTGAYVTAYLSKAI